MASRNENDLVEALYDAALGYRSWDEVNRGMTDHVGGETLMLSVHHSRTASVDVIGWLGLNPESLQEYPTFAPHDLWVTGFMGQRHFGRVMVGSHVVDDRMLTRSFIYNEYLRPQLPIFHLVGSVLPMDGGYHAAIGIHRPRDAQDFSATEAKRTERLLPHLRRALEIRRRLQHAEQTSRSIYSVLDRLSLGVIMLSATGNLLHVNAAADSILRSADGLIRTPAGLRAGRKEDDRRLQELIAGLRQTSADTRSAGGHLRIHRPSGRQAYALMLTPVGPGLVSGGKHVPATLVFVSDPGEKIASDLAVLTELFGFPRAEGRLVLALLAGVTAPEFAQATGVTYNTVRTLLARAMARTDSRSQVELVLLVAGSIGGLIGQNPLDVSRGNP